MIYIHLGSQNTPPILLPGESYTLNLCKTDNGILDQTNLFIVNGGACGVMVIVIGNGHSDTSSNPGRSWLHFT